MTTTELPFYSIRLSDHNVTTNPHGSQVLNLNREEAESLYYDLREYVLELN